MQIFQNSLNFSFSIQKPPDLNWGTVQEDGSWNGMIKELLLEKADIGNAYGIVYRPGHPK